jgi:hypothetical protein
MSAASVPSLPKSTPEPLRAIEAELNTESAAIEKLRKQLSEAGAGASKELLADYAKRQKAFLDRKIDFEKQKRAFIETPAPAAVTAPRSIATPPKKEAPKPAAPAKPSAAAKPKPAPEKAPAAKKAAPEKPAESKPEVPEPRKKRAEFPKPKTAAPQKRKPALLDEDEESSDTSGGEGLTPLAWLLIAAVVGVAIWYFATR